MSPFLITPPISTLFSYNEGYTDQDGVASFSTWWPALADNTDVQTEFYNDDDYAKSPNAVTRASTVLVAPIGPRTWSLDGGYTIDVLLVPADTSNMVVNCRVRKSIATDPATYTETVELRQNYVDEGNQGTLIATLTVASATADYTDYSHTLTAPEVALLVSQPADAFYPLPYYLQLFFRVVTVAS